MKIELCAASIEAIQLAKELKLDRIELCQNLENGGMTPSPGFIEYALAFGVETHVLIRPRSGGFRYNKDEIEIILRDIRECRAIGAHGVVVGALNEHGTINEKAVEMFVEKADGMTVTFHRAFDDLFNYRKAIDQLVDLGVDRILSSGLARNVELGLNNLHEMIQYANGRIEIMPGGGVNMHNVKKLCAETCPSAVHFSGTVKHDCDENSMFSETILKVDRQKVERILEQIR